MFKTTIIGLYNANCSARSLAKHLSISRNTVVKYIRQYLVEKEILSKTPDPIMAAKIQQEMLDKNQMDVMGWVARKFSRDIEQRFYQTDLLNEKRNKVLGANKQETNGAVVHRQLRKKSFDIRESYWIKQTNDRLKTNWKKDTSCHDDGLIFNRRGVHFSVDIHTYFDFNSYYTAHYEC